MDPTGVFVDPSGILSSSDSGNAGAYDPTQDPTSPDYQSPSVGGDNTYGTPASGSWLAAVSQAAASLGATVSNIINAQKYGYQLSATGGGPGVAAVPTIGNAFSTMNPVVLIGLVILAVWAFKRA